MIIQSNYLENNGADYLKRILENEGKLSEDRIKIILAASILRYSEGIIIIDFVFDLNKAIANQKTVINGNLLEITSLLAHLEHQVIFQHINKETIEKRLRNILEKLDR